MARSDLAFLEENGVEVGTLWPDNAEVPDGYLLSRQFWALGRDLDTNQEYGVTLTMTRRPEPPDVQLVHDLRASLAEYEGQHGVRRFRRQVRYEETLYPEPKDADGDE